MGALDGILGGAASAAVGSGLGLLSGIGSGKRARKLLAKQEEAQSRLNQESAQLNYDYGELAADAAHERSLGLLQAETEANSYQSKVADAEAAGLSVGLLYGGAGGGGGASAGGGAQGGGAGNQRSKAAEYLEIMAAQQAQKQADAEIARTINEGRLIDAQRENIQAETENIKEDTATSKETTPIQVELLRQQGIGKLLENARTEWENSGGGETEVFRNVKLDHTGAISKDSYFDRRIAEDIAEAISRTEGNKALTELNTEKKNGYWQELLNATAHANAAEAQAAAIKLASEWSTGEYTNWKTWTTLATDALGGITDIIKAGKK